MKWETYGNLGCRTLPCCPQYTSSFPYFNYLVFFPPPWRRKHKLKLLISEINSWMQYQSQPHATGLSGPSDPFQFSGGSPVKHPCHTEGMTDVQGQPGTLLQQQVLKRCWWYLCVSTRYKPGQPPVPRHTCLNGLYFAKNLPNLPRTVIFMPN